MRIANSVFEIGKPENLGLQTFKLESESTTSGFQVLHATPLVNAKILSTCIDFPNKCTPDLQFPDTVLSLCRVAASKVQLEPGMATSLKMSKR